MTRPRGLLAAVLGTALATTALTTTAVSGTPAAAAAASVPLSDCADPDNGSPVITEFGIGGHVVDAREQVQQVPVSAVAEDTGGPGAATGIAHLYVTFEAPVDARVHTAGTALTRQPDGTWAGSVPFLPGSASGTWTASARAVDGTGHEKVLDADALRALGTDPTVVVTSVEDLAAPALRSLRLSSRTVDSRQRARRVTVTARATDTVSGVRTVVVRVAGRPTALHLAAGTRTDGTWRGSVTVSRWAGVHTWPLQVRLADRASRVLALTRDKLAHRGLPSTLRVVGRTDRTSPTVSAQRVTPTYLDVRSEDGSLRVSVRARDALSGVATVLANIEREYGTYLNVRLHRVSGTRHDGVWAATVPFDHCQDGYRPFSGVTSMSFAARAYDAAGQWRDLAASGQKRFDVEFRDNAWPTYNAHAEQRRIGVAVSEAVVANGTWDPSVTVAETGVEVAGTWACLDLAGATVDCAANALVGAWFTPAEPLAPATRYAVLLNREHTLHVVDLAGNPVIGQEYDPTTPAS